MYTDIRIDGESLDLGPVLKVPLDLINPHLSYETIPNSVANVPSIPFSAKNQRIFEYCEMPQAGNDLYSYDCEMFYNGALIYRGKAYVKVSNPISGYQLSAGDDLGRFFGLYGGIPLTELNLGTVEIPEVLTPTIEVGEALAVCFPTIVNPDYYGTNGALISYTGFVNECDEEVYTTTGPKVPQLFVGFLLGRIAELTGVTVSGDFLTHPTWSKLVITNWRSLDLDPVITVNRHVPAWTIATLLIELRKIPNLRLRFDTINKSLTIDFWEPLIDQVPRKDWTLRATPGHEKIPEFNRRLQLAFDLDGGDSLVKDKPEDLADYFTPVTGSLGGDAVGLVKVPMKLSTFLIDDETGLPIARQTGVTMEFNQLNVNTMPRLLFWHGLIDGVPAAFPNLDGISLYMNGPHGIAATSWARTEQMRREMFYLKKKFSLNELDLAQLDFSEPIHYNGLNYLVAHIAGELPITAPFVCLLVKI
ncbi:hypothetical protein [Dyadobacter sp. CY323]|uniref:hypothetical protein n=1 Tax=Dyadobacter sp. CY323 TaxID=2907302 RepID=UPI001F176D98|nr:hypothetical protein [Dyadobacter sp. CY323]MCE6987482.1 hypothetical protein [Dyadobacter sp. CY323]